MPYRVKHLLTGTSISQKEENPFNLLFYNAVTSRTILVSLVKRLDCTEDLRLLSSYAFFLVSFSSLGDSTTYVKKKKPNPPSQSLLFDLSS